MFDHYTYIICKIDYKESLFFLFSSSSSGKDAETRLDELKRKNREFS